jgi:hypothetical protein
MNNKNIRPEYRWRSEMCRCVKINLIKVNYTKVEISGGKIKKMASAGKKSTYPISLEYTGQYDS